ncbi:MAG: TolC family protein [Fibrobacter sp.]|nr:TolC family protein [Fibrobacter sp.]
MRNRFFILLTFFITFASFIHAQILISEQDAVREAVENNLSVSILKLEQHKAFLAKENLHSQWLPQLSLNLQQDFIPYNNFAESSSNWVKDSEQLSETGLNFSIQQALPGGGKVFSEFHTKRTDALGTNSVLYNSGGSVNFLQPLLQNAWGNDPVKSSIYTQTLDQKQLTLSQKRTIISIISETRKQYWNLFENQALIRLYEKQREYSAKRLEADREKLAIGLATPMDTLNAALSFMKSTTEIMRLEGDMVVAHKEFANVLGRDTLDVVFSLTDSISFYSLFPTEELIEQAKKFDPQLDILQVMHDKLLHEQSRARNQLLPELDFQAGYGYDGINSKFFGDNQNYNQNLVFSLIAGYSLPIRNKKNQVKSKELEIEENRIQKKQLVNELRIKIDELRTAWEKELAMLDVLQKTKEIADKQLEAAQAGYNLGTIDRLSLVDAENSFLSASIDLLRSQLTMKRILIVVEEVTGTVLERFGVAINE